MGQMTHAVMLGAPMVKPPKGKTWWGDSKEVGGEYVYEDGLLDMFKSGRGPKPETDENANVIGFFVACGASGKSGVPDLKGPIDLARFEKAKPYAKAIAKARKAWERFAVFCQKQGVKLEKPRFFLVETEVG